MNIVKKTFLSVAAFTICSISSFANADVIHDVEEVTPVQITASKPFTFIQNILDTAFVIGDTVSKATLAIFLTDPNGGGEKYQFLIGSDQTFSYTNANISQKDGYTEYVTLSANSLADLNKDGMLSVKISTEKTGVNDEFFFVSSTLDATLTKAASVPPSSTDVPEPATVALMGLGLLGFAASRRKLAKSNKA